MTLPTFHMIEGAPDPVAPFSHAVEVDGWVFVTGQLPFPGGSSTASYPEGVEAQTRQVMENLKRVLAGCGLGLEHVVAARVFLTHFDHGLRAHERGVRRLFLRRQAPGTHLRRCDGARARGAGGDRLYRAPRSRSRRRRARQ